MLRGAALQEIPYSVAPLTKRYLVVHCQQVSGQLPRALGPSGDDECAERDAQKQHFVMLFILSSPFFPIPRVV